jgi:protein-disulfide isomerase
MSTQSVENQNQTGQSALGPGTPAFFINGVRYDGPLDLALLLEALESASVAHSEN